MKTNADLYLIENRKSVRCKPKQACVLVFYDYFMGDTNLIYLQVMNLACFALDAGYVFIAK